MIDYDKELVSALGTVLPTHHELKITSRKTPCITYQERNNYDDATGDTIGYSRISYTIKVWGTKAEVQQYAKEVDKVVRPLGFKRTSTNELSNHSSTMIQKIMTYEALALEEYN